MENPADGAPPLVAAPRHLRRRVFHAEIPDTLLVPSAEPIAMEAERTVSARRQAEDSQPEAARIGSPSAGRQKPDSGEVSRQRKRTVALVITVLVAIAIPALTLALIFGG